MFFEYMQFTFFDYVFLVYVFRLYVLHSLHIISFTLSVMYIGFTSLHYIGFTCTPHAPRMCCPSRCFEGIRVLVVHTIPVESHLLRTPIVYKMPRPGSLLLVFVMYKGF